MSIPPLVCNTPPPPDQCEDEKEDFDLHYTLSQEDDDESEFGFQGFSSYSQHHSNINYNEGQEEICKSINLNLPNEEHLQKFEQDDKNIEIAFNDKTQINVTEEINVEDLNLSVQDEDIIVASRVVPTDVVESNKEMKSNVSDSGSDNPSDNFKITELESNILEKPDSSLFINSIEIEPNLHNINTINDIDVDDSNLDQDITEYDVNDLTHEKQSKDHINDVYKNETEITSQLNEESDNEFDDLKDSQVSTDSPPNLVVNSEMHWENLETEQHSEFSGFKANFESIAAIEKPIEDKQKNLNNFSTFEEDDDEFGDFDEFKSNVDESKNNRDISPDQQIFNSQTQIENVNKMFSSIFESEAPIGEIVVETSLDASLGETWRHLLGTDERQPYMVAWNNSCGQKSLLKALCIDSRNILFTPKWNSNTPKFAANLSNAPLQPQKQLSSGSDISSDKQSIKPSSSWTDSITAEGKESCKTDKESTSSESRHNIEMFSPVPNKSGQIYSSTLSVQPMRQINLPDTHIFTPTDSETPRSKTIHYSSGNILHPQSSSEPNSLSIDKELTKQDSEENEYWEFQDFKGASETNVPIPTAAANSTSYSLAADISTTVGTQILQPVKVDMLMPTLNWPNPGEIKETFDNFTDFISNTEQNDTSAKVTQQTDSSIPVITPNIITPVVATIKDTSDNHISDTKFPPPADNFDDFDTFQSALPPSKSSTHLSIPMNTVPKIPSNIDYGFFNRSEKASTPNISNENTRPNNALTPNLSGLEKTSLPMQTTEIPMISTSILQPTITNSNSSNQKAGQILQPMSLESYSQINWPNPGIDLQDLSRFNPVDTLQSLKSDLSAGTQSKGASPIHNHKVVRNQPEEDDVWGEFVSSKPKQPTFSNQPVADDDEWSDFISSPNMKTQSGLNTISFNVHTNTNLQKPSNKLSKNNDASFDIPTLNYITPKSGSSKSYNIDRHLQRL